jgi:hypothetical protein
MFFDAVIIEVTRAAEANPILIVLTSVKATKRICSFFVPMITLFNSIAW